MPLQATSGAASYDAFGGGVPVVPNYIEDVFSTYLYTGNGSVQGIANGINLGSTYGGSGYFGGASATSGLTAPASSSWQLTGDYTVEAWIYVVTLANGTIYATGGSGAADQFTYTAAGELYFANQGTGTGVITAGSWIHVAAARSGTTQKIFINGVAQSTTTVSGTIGQNATAYIGRRVDTTNYVTGYISNLRVVNGTAVYTSNFTPSTVPLTAITNTVLLTCQSNGFVDASTNAFTITNNNAVAVTNYGPFTSATAGKGGLVWIKNRNATWGHILSNTIAGIPNSLNSNTTNAQDTGNTYVSAFSTTGFSVSDAVPVNANTQGIVSWTFRKQPKFFDIVTWTGDAVSSRRISHNLGSVPGCIIVKKTSGIGNWVTWHRTFSNLTENYLLLSETQAVTSSTDIWGTYAPNSTDFGTGTTSLNASGATYVAYLFAHNAGGFGLTGTDNVISCGTFTTDGSGAASVTLGYEPQWILIKSTNFADSWLMYDNMRGMPVSSTSAQLYANTTAAESAGFRIVSPTATGFSIPSTGNFGNNNTFVYIVLRRGPMKVPTVGTSVFTPIARTGNGTNTTLTGVGFAPDLTMTKTRVAGYYGFAWDRLRGPNLNLSMSLTDAEDSSVTDALVGFDVMDGVRVGIDNNLYYINGNAQTFINWNFKRAPSFFDEVCYTGTGSNQTLSHNLTVAPTLMIIKRRNTTGDWWVIDVTGSKQLNLNQNYAASALTTTLVPSSPTTTTFSVGTYSQVNGSGNTFVAYLFATCAGVSKVGSYTGNGTTQTIDCGFGAGGARFVLIKRTDSTGDWYVWDTARGIVAGNDPYLRLNAPSSEVTNTDYIDTYSAGFEISSTAPAEINASGGTFIFLAIA